MNNKQDHKYDCIEDVVNVTERTVGCTKKCCAKKNGVVPNYDGGCNSNGTSCPLNHTHGNNRIARGVKRCRDGDDGDKGVIGSIGEKGYRGDMGSPGDLLVGHRGKRGCAGEQGIEGDKGPTGPPGLQGYTGVTGADGFNNGCYVEVELGLSGSLGSTATIIPAGVVFVCVYAFGSGASGSGAAATLKICVKEGDKFHAAVEYEKGEITGTLVTLNEEHILFVEDGDFLSNGSANDCGQLDGNITGPSIGADNEDNPDDEVGKVILTYYSSCLKC
jgi:hypothetical protein